MGFAGDKGARGDERQRRAIAKLSLVAHEHVFNETPTGVIDGVNVTYTLAVIPNAGSVQLFKNGLLLRLTTDYTISGLTITMASAPSGADYLRAHYTK